jgi:hypothetical protein
MAGCVAVASLHMARMKVDNADPRKLVLGEMSTLANAEMG